MTSAYQHIIRAQARVLQPLPTGVPARLYPLSGLRGVFLDVYGTMFISHSGEMGTGIASQQATAWTAAMEAMGLDVQLSEEAGVGLLHETIRTHHARRRADGVEYPEVDIVAVWRDLLGQLHGPDAISQDRCRQVDCCRLAVEYESRANPVWPMPRLTACLASLRQANLLLGIISNAQFFTRELFPALLSQTVEQAGFAADLQYYSYRYGRAKPDSFLFQRAKEALESRGVAAEQILYVGNDMLNDILPAKACGFRTALLAGDARSLRLRQDDPRVHGLSADLVLTSLDDLPQCVVD